ncbi:MAG: glycosyl hydrolase 115 family protein [Bacteroidia bacterium]|nr:glycosyl hydrolase 115 family protein [Bacteroidia bacterium]
MQRYLVVLLISLSLAINLKAQPTFGTQSFISFDSGILTLSAKGKSAPLLVSSKDWPGVIRAFKDLQSDIEKVTSVKPEFCTDNVTKSQEVIIAGTIGKSPLIDDLVKKKKIDVSDVAGKWEAFSVQVVNKPMKGVKKALVIAGSNKRGTIYGIYEMSRQIGVSPWYWWADVPVNHKDALYALDIRYVQGSPSVKYRGIFLNDEAPDLTNWVRAKYGTVPIVENPPMPNGVANYGREFYTKLFELMLRLKGNYLWPAMWNNAFNEDDPENPKLADEYGIVMGNSHQEPMLRAQKEWDRRYQKKIGSWNYTKNPDVLEAFWREGISRNKNYESIVTIGLRGANDTPMAPGGPEANMALLEKIVGVQRKILTEEMNTEIEKIPQLWCLYKEVQDYYNAGMRVPDDVTLLWAEDNWGNVRRLPTADERKRSGGAGIYYHFDYHGGPRSYQWINTNPISKIWDQMSLAKQYGADRIWIVNVGHFKGYELPIEYFLDLAWNTEKLTAENIFEYTEYWAAREFGPDFAKETADIMSLYTKYNGRRKPELLSPSIYSLTNYREAERVVEDFNALSYKATTMSGALPPEKRDAFYQLVLFPAMTSSIVNELYMAAGKNLLYSKQGRASTNNLADYVQILFQTDTILMGYFNRDFAGGKWNHFMDQSHLGYTSWADPPVNSLRAINLKRTDPPKESLLGVTVEGSEAVWPGNEGIPVLPGFDIFNNQKFSIEVFNKGTIPFDVKSESEDPWVKISREKIPIGGDDRLWISIDWSKVKNGKNEGKIKISGAGSEVIVLLTAFKPDTPSPETLNGFVEGNGYVSMEAEHYSSNSKAGDRQWIKIEDYGHTLSGMRAYTAADAPPAVPGNDSPCLEYKMYIFNPGDLEVTSVFSPTLNFMPGRDLTYAISFDNQPPSVITLVPGNYNAQNRNTDWEKSVSDNARFSISKHNITSIGYHTLKIWMVDPGPVIQKIIVNTGGLKPSYLGPPESFNNKIVAKNN